MFILLATQLFACFEKNQETDSSHNDDHSDTDSLDTGDTASSDTGNSSSTTDEVFGEQNLILIDSDGYTPVADRISLNFSSDNEFGFSGGCNSFGGEFSVDNNTFIATSVFGTEMGCNLLLSGEDEWLVSFFTGSPTFTFEGEDIIFSSADATLTFSDRETIIPDAQLVDNVWLINTFTEGNFAMAYNLDTTPSVSFQSNGMVDVNTGCNSGSGEYSITNDTITVNVDTVTEAFCTDDNAVTAEAHILGVFAGPTLTFSITENHLSLENENIGKGIGATLQ